MGGGKSERGAGDLDRATGALKVGPHSVGGGNLLLSPKALRGAVFLGNRPPMVPQIHAAHARERGAKGRLRELDGEPWKKDPKHTDKDAAEQEIPGLRGAQGFPRKSPRVLS